MHNIIDVRHIDGGGGGGRIVLEETDGDGKGRIFNQHEVRCVYLEQLLGKCAVATKCDKQFVYSQKFGGDVIRDRFM